MTRFWLVRHGQASFDEDDYDRLSPVGAQQARTLGLAWQAAGLRPEGAWSGTLRRQTDTARAVLELAHPATSAIPLAAFDELDPRAIFFGWRPDLADPAALQAWKAAPGDYGRRFTATWQAARAAWLAGALPGVETWPALRARVLAAMGELVMAARQSQWRDLAVFTSAGPISAVLQACQGVADGEVGGLQDGLPNASVTLVEAAGPVPADWRCVRRADVAHLAAAGLTATAR